ncbi:Mu transposase domain-containing protein, partial [Haloechinothrix alba]
RAGHRRVYRPWIPEPGLWLQFDWGQGPRIGGRATYLFCAWLAWSRFRVVLPSWDRSLGSLLACLDATLRRIGGVPTYVLTDNEKTVTVDHVATVAVRHPEIVAASRHYGLTIHTCYPADPESKGGSESTVRIAKADLVPASANLRGEYASFAELATACRTFCDEVNGRPHRETGRIPAEALADEQSRLHPVVEQPYAAAFGQTRRVMWDSTISYAGVRYSVPHELLDERVWARVDGDEVVITHLERTGPVEVARHPHASKGHPQINDAHYPTRIGDPTRRAPRARSASDAEFLAIGQGAAQWLEEAAAGTARIRAKMAEAVSLAKLYGHTDLDRALGTAALAGRFGEADLASILAHHR